MGINIPLLVVGTQQAPIRKRNGGVYQAVTKRNNQLREKIARVVHNPGTGKILCFRAHSIHKVLFCLYVLTVRSFTHSQFYGAVSLNKQ